MAFLGLGPWLPCEGHNWLWHRGPASWDEMEGTGSHPVFQICFEQRRQQPIKIELDNLLEKKHTHTHIHIYYIYIAQKPPVRSIKTISLDSSPGSWRNPRCPDGTPESKDEALPGAIVPGCVMWHQQSVRDLSQYQKTFQYTYKMCILLNIYIYMYIL